MRRPLRTTVALLVASTATVAGYAVDSARGEGSTPRGPGLVTVSIDVEHSRFSTDRIVVRPGTLVRFLVRNHDPINHELIVGDETVHARHEAGGELVHPPVPGEVSVGAGERGVTTFAFGAPGTYVFACHLPGHVAYGMEGVVVVTQD